eukprot:UN02531
MNQVMICFGILVSEFIQIGFRGHGDWKILLALCCAPAVFQLATFWSFKESPAWLIKNGRGEEAIESLKSLRGHDNIQWELDLISKSIRKISIESRATAMSINSDIRAPDIMNKPLLAFPEEDPKNSLNEKPKNNYR